MLAARLCKRRLRIYKRKSPCQLLAGRLPFYSPPQTLCGSNGGWLGSWRGGADEGKILRVQRRMCVSCIHPALPKGRRDRCAGREQVIAEHACQKYSGRAGRSANAKALDEKAITLAVIAHIRHAETDYDNLLAQGGSVHWRANR